MHLVYQVFWDFLKQWFAGSLLLVGHVKIGYQKCDYLRLKTDNSKTPTPRPVGTVRSACHRAPKSNIS
jgi:hypothetical protein